MKPSETQNRRGFVITVDGPSGSGKSTVARKVAKRLGLLHLNSGALYRAVGLEAEHQKLSLRDEDALAKLSEQMKFSFVSDSQGDTRLFEDGEPSSKDLSSEKAGALASQIAVLPRVRNCLNEVQRRAAQGVRGVVLEGRDAGTVVFPDADAKFYLDASIAERARRRFVQLAGEGQSGSFVEVEKQIRERDHRDSTRDVAPQVQAKDAYLIDTSKLSEDEVVEEIARRVKASGAIKV